jgi:hypothetical protein
MTLKELKECVYTRLKILSGITVFDGKAPEDAVFPYLVYKLTSSNHNFRNRTDRVLDIDYWDNSNDDTALLTASDYVRKGRTIDGVQHFGLDYSWQTDTNGFFRSYVDFEGEIPEPSPGMSRMQQRYIINVD